MLAKLPGLGLQGLSQAQALSLMSSLHLARSQNSEQTEKHNIPNKDEDMESDIEVTDRDAPEGGEGSPQRGRKTPRDEREDCAAEDLSVKRRKIDINEDAEDEEHDESNETITDPLKTIQEKFIDIIRRNAAQAQCK